MSEVRVCDHCDFLAYADAPAAPSLRTLEYLDGEEVVATEDAVVCWPCYEGHLEEQGIDLGGLGGGA